MKRWICTVMALLMMTGVITPFFETNVSAASASTKYRKFDTEANSGSTVKSKGKAGKYYFWVKGPIESKDNNYAGLYYSKTKNGKGKLLINNLIYDGGWGGTYVITNGKYVFYKDDRGKATYVFRKNIKSRKVKKYKIAGMGSEFFVYKNNLYYFNAKRKLVTYNLKTKKAKKTKLFKGASTGVMMAGKGRYLYICRGRGGKIIFYRYDIKKGKLKKVRTIKGSVAEPITGYHVYLYIGERGYMYSLLKNTLKKS